MKKPSYRGVGTGPSNWNATKASEVMGDWRRSGGSLAQYARVKGVSLKRLYWWKTRLASVPAPLAVATPAFVPVVVRATPRLAPSVIVVALGDAMRVEVHELSSASAAWVAMLARAEQESAS